MRVLIIKGSSQYGGTRLFADHATEAFQRQGHEVEVLDAAGADGVARILAYRPQGPLDLVFTIAIGGEVQDGSGRTLRDVFGAPHVVWHTDYALSQAHRLRGTPASTALLLVDPTQVEAVRSIYGPERFAHLDFFPHPAFGEPAPDDATLEEFVERRPIKVLWSGSFQKPAPPWGGVAGPGRRAFQDAFDLAMSEEWMPPHVALDTVLASRGLDLKNPDNIPVREAATLVDIEIRMARRFAFLKAVAKTGVPIHICGLGWESQLYRFKNATFEGPVDMPRVAELMRRSRLVLNTNGNFGGGSHERPFSASLAGAATFSDYSRYYGEIFEPTHAMELFRWQALDAGMDRLTALAEDPASCFDYARSAKALTLAGHTWDSRIAIILRAADAVR
jgi:hypothetical protein